MAITKIGTPELFDFSSLNTALQLPTGPTSGTGGRPSSPSTGEWRFNTTLKYVEYWDGGAWRQIDTEALPTPDDFPSQNFNVTTYYGNVTARTLDAKFNEAANFNGASSGSQIFISDADVFSPANNDLSFSVWIKTTSTSVGYIASKQDDGAATYEWQFYMNTNGTVAIGVYTSSGTHIATATSTATVNDGNWHNVAFVIDTNTSVTVYVDKAGVTNSSWSGTMSNTSTDVGLGYGGENMSGNRLEGALDQARFFNTALTSTQINSLNDNETTTTAATLDFPSGAGCFAAYPLDGDASDLSGTYGGVTTSVYYTGLRFQPDFVWTKNRGLAEPHMLYDSVRGVEQTLYSNDTDAQYNDSGSLTSFNSNGFGLGTYTGTNRDGYEFVAWCFKGGGNSNTWNIDGTGYGTVSAAGLDGGTISPTGASVNTGSGFSIIQYTGNDTQDATYNTGLTVTSDLVITKSTSTMSWYVWSSVLPSGTNYLKLEASVGQQTTYTPLYPTNPVSGGAGVFKIGSDQGVNESTKSYISYHFANISGYQKIGTYPGTGLDVGNYIYTDSNGDGTGTDGFEPAFLLVKRTDTSADWFIYDNKRMYTSEAPHNPFSGELRPNRNIAEDDYDGYNFYSNGFELANSGTNMNASGGTYLYLAIAADKNTSVPSADNSFETTLYSGSGSAQPIYGSFKPDFVWTKNYLANASHYLFDSVRGPGKEIYSDLTTQEYADPATLTSFAPNGFSVGTGTGVNNSSNSYVAWNWKAGPPSININGTRKSVVSANANAGFSIVSWKGDGATATIGHGLGVAPNLIFVKKLDGTSNWPVYSSVLTSAAYRLLLDDTVQQNTTNDEWNSTAPTADVFSVGNGGNVSDNDKAFIGYCFANKAGYVSIGSYAGNGLATGVFTVTGFEPSWLLVKEYDDAGGYWIIVDNKRNTSNPRTLNLFPNAQDVETNFGHFDFLSSGGGGFQPANNNADTNASGKNYLYMAIK
jgi:hypothetical protein